MEDRPCEHQIGRLAAGAIYGGSLDGEVVDDGFGHVAGRRIKKFTRPLAQTSFRYIPCPVKVAIPKETAAGERRVALVPDTATKLIAAGLQVSVQAGAGGTVAPARVLVMGAGVAGLQAIATARRLGAVVSAYDVRPAVKEEVHSLGATFIELPLESQEGEGGYAREQSEEFLRKQRELIGEHIAKSDVVITTAAVPGRRAPLLVTADMVKGMRPGSIIVDLAAESGGNVELTKAGSDVDVNGVMIMGRRNVPSTMPLHTSQPYARHVANLLLQLVTDGAINRDSQDEITTSTCLRHAA